MGAHATAMNLDRALRAGFFNVPDPGASGTISWTGKGQAICALVTAGAESRALPDASGFGVGTMLLVYGSALAGTATITGAATGSVALTADGNHVEFTVVEDGGVKQWNALQGSISNVVTRATAAASADLIPVSNGADKALKAATPAALGAVAITTGHSATNVALIALVDALAAFGLVTHTWTNGDA